MLRRRSLRRDEVRGLIFWNHKFDNSRTIGETQWTRKVAIIGAGPVGLAAAAHVLERGMTPIVLEAGPEAGYSIRQWQHVQLFSPWEYNVDKAAARLLAPTGWNSPDPQIVSDRRRTSRTLHRAAGHQDIVARRDPDEQPGDRRRAEPALIRPRPRDARPRPSRSDFRMAKVRRRCTPTP